MIAEMKFIRKAKQDWRECYRQHMTSGHLSRVRQKSTSRVFGVIIRSRIVYIQYGRDVRTTQGFVPPLLSSLRTYCTYITERIRLIGFRGVLVPTDVRLHSTNWSQQYIARERETRHRH